MTITGTREQKEQALTSIVADLFDFQGLLHAVVAAHARLEHRIEPLPAFPGVPEDSPDICVLVMPSCAIGAVIGTKGAKIRNSVLLAILCQGPRLLRNRYCNGMTDTEVKSWQSPAQSVALVVRLAPSRRCSVVLKPVLQGY